MKSTREHIARATRVFLAAAATASLGFEGNFSGCGGAPPPSGPVPEGPSAECLRDDDCAEMMCRVSQCVASRCVMRESVVDADRDGEGALPCGNDCDDRSPARSPMLEEACDLIDNDCDDRVDEGTVATFVAGEISAPGLGSAPVTVGTIPGLLFVSNFGARSLEARWIGTESGQLGLANIEDSRVGLAAARSLGADRAEVVWSTSVAPFVIRRAVLRVVVTSGVSILVESTETLATLPSRALNLQLEGDATGSVVLVEASGTRLILPGLAPIDLSPPSDFDLAVAGERVVVPAATGELNFYDRRTGSLQGTFRLDRAFRGPDAIVAWGTRLFAFSTPTLTEIDPLTLRPLRTIDLDGSESVSFGALSDELVYIARGRGDVQGLDASLAPTTHATLAVWPGDRIQIHELGTRLVVVNLEVGSAIYQVEQCGG